MKQILSFSLFEARYSTHFDKRFKERIGDLQEVGLDTKSKDEIESELEKEIGPNWKKLLLSSIISNTESRMLKKIKLENYSNDGNFGVPISFLNLKHKGKLYPIEITTYSSSDKDGEDKVYRGSQIWVALGQDTAWTIKVFPKDKNKEYVSDNLRDGVSSRYKGNSFSFVEPSQDFKSIFEWDPKKGKFITDEEETEKDLVPVSKSIPERKTIGPGDKIGLIAKAVSDDEFTDGVVKDITNFNEIKDKQKTGDLGKVEGIKVSFLPTDKSQRFTKDGREIPFSLTIKSGSRIKIDGEEYLVLGPEKGKSLVTSEPSIIKMGKVQTWVQRP
jgi:hypothetical protein